MADARLAGATRISIARCGRARLADFVNQRQVTSQLEVFIEAARRRGESLDHVLLAGPPGLGKTSLAHIIAAELEAPIVQTAGPALERKADIASFLTALEPGSVFFIDEIHRLNRAIEETLYPAMEDRRLPIVLGQGAGARTVDAGPAGLHPGRRDHPRRAADDAAARPLRRLAPARALRARRPGADRRALGRDPRGRDRAPGRAGDRDALARHATRRQPPAEAGPRLRRGSRGGRHHRRGRRRGARRCSRSTRPASTATTARSSRRSRSSSPAGRSGSRPWRRPSTRSRRRSRTSMSPTCSSRDCSSGRRAAG